MEADPRRVAGARAERDLRNPRSVRERGWRADARARPRDRAGALRPPARSPAGERSRDPGVHPRLARPPDPRLRRRAERGGAGGAPFWAVGSDGSRSLQIVESSQVDLGDPAQRKIWSSATHFNPVDIIAGLRRWNGEPFRLASFVDPDAIFVSKKSREGRELFALELPGLWNGAMAGWNTLFVEVPGSTFAPVKTVLDLLRPAHQRRT